MQKSRILWLALLSVTAACQDGQRQAPTEPIAPSAPALSASGEGGSASTVCDTYRETLAGLKAELAANPGSDSLAGQVSAYEELILDICD